MKRENSRTTRCGIDTVEISRVEELLRNKTPEELHRLFSEQELQDAGDGAGRTGSLAARFAAKEACGKLFPRETALGVIGPTDFSVRRDAYGAPVVEVSPNARAVLDRHRIARGAVRSGKARDEVRAGEIDREKSEHHACEPESCDDRMRTIGGPRRG